MSTHPYGPYWSSCPDCGADHETWKKDCADSEPCEGCEWFREKGKKDAPKDT